jgi:putative ABC transport system permease protein
MHDLKLAFRNILRNTRRSVVTILAIALSCAGITLLSGYVSWTYRSVESQTVCTYSHIQIFKKGFFDQGGGNPAAYAIGGYDRLKSTLLQDPVIAPRLELVTPQILFNGIVSHYAKDTSSTFRGLGVAPEEYRRLVTWNPYHIFDPTLLKQNRALFAGKPELDSSDPDGGSVGVGLAKILRLDLETAEQQAQRTRRQPPANPETQDSTRERNSDTLIDPRGQPAFAERPSVELLAAPATGGVPNVTSLYIRTTFTTASKEYDDQLVMLSIRKASELLFPGQELKATGILLLLKRSSDVPVVSERLAQFISEKNLDLEFKTWTDIRPFYKQLTRMFDMLFVFTFCIIAVIVTFAIYNTMATSILERTNEIGTLRAMGRTKAGVLKSFVLEGLLLGAAGGVLGAVLAVGIELLIRALEIVYVPPGVTFYAKLEVLVLSNPTNILCGLLTALLSSLISSALPARRASVMPIVDALRHS